MYALRSAVGTNVAVSPSGETETVPAWGKAIPEMYVISCKFAGVTVSGSTGLLNCSCTTGFSGTPIEELGGLTLATEGVVESLVDPVVNENVPGFVNGRPPTSVRSAVVVIVYVVPAAIPPSGVKVIC